MLVLTAGCYGKNGVYGRGGSFGFGAPLSSHYVYAGHDEPIPVCHVIFVPQWDPPRVNHGFVHGDGGDERTYHFRYSYQEQGIMQFEVQPLTVRRPMLGRDVFEGGGRRFELRDGNVFVAAVHRDGSVKVTQLPRLEGIREPNEILAHVKSGFPNDPRIQALQAAS